MAKDPVCGMLVNEAKGQKYDYKDQTYYFCLDYCQQRFEKDPKKYVELIQTYIPNVEKERTIAYFSMEVAVHAKVPTYSGGLGILAGDTLRSCADLKVPIVAVTLFYEQGYFQQRLDEQGNQDELPGGIHPFTLDGTGSGHGRRGIRGLVRRDWRRAGSLTDEFNVWLRMS